MPEVTSGHHEDDTLGQIADHQVPLSVLAMGNDAIDAKHARMGLLFGQPTGDARFGSGGGVVKPFERATFFWKKDLGACAVFDLVLGRYRELGEEGSFLGYPTADVELTIQGAEIGRFQFGSISSHPDLGTHEVHGLIHEKWFQLGAEQGVLGYPNTDSTGTADGIGSFSGFEHGSIYFHPDIGARAVQDQILLRWGELGFERSFLGYPVSDQTPTDAGGVMNRFQRGEIRLGASGSVVVVPDSVQISPPIVTEETVGGSVVWTMDSSGQWVWEGHLHNSGFLALNTTVVTRLKFVDPAGRGFVTSPVSKTLAGTGLGSRDFDWQQGGNSPVIRENWDAVRATGVSTTIDFSPSAIDIIAKAFEGIVFLVSVLFVADGKPKRVTGCPGHPGFDGQQTGATIIITDQEEPAPPCPGDI